MYHACMHTRPPARSASRAAAPPPKVALFALEDNQSSAEALELTMLHKFASCAAVQEAVDETRDGSKAERSPEEFPFRVPFQGPLLRPDTHPLDPAPEWRACVRGRRSLGRQRLQRFVWSETKPQPNHFYDIPQKG